MPAGHAAPAVATLAASGDAPRPLAGFTLGEDAMSPSVLGLNWTATSDLFFSSYTVEPSTNGSSGPWQSAGVITQQGTTQFAATGLSPGAGYSWRVVETGLGGSQTTNTLFVAQPPLATLNDSLVGGTTVRLNWTNNASYGGALGFVQYALWESVAGASPNVVATITSAAVRGTVLSGLSPGTSYSFYLNTTDCYAGCGSATPSRATTESNTVTVGPPLPLVASISADRSMADVGQADYLTCTPSGGSSPFTFEWDYGNGTFVAGPSSVAHVFTTAGVETLRCQVTDATSAHSTAATTVTVNPAAAAQIALNRTQLDAGGSVAVGCEPSGGSPPYALAVTYGDGSGATLPAGTNVSHAYLAPGAFMATCVVTDGAGAQVAAPDAVHVSSDPTVAANASSPAAAPGTDLSFVGDALNGSGDFASYAWSFGDGSTATTATADHAYAAAGNYTAVFRAVDSNGVAAVRDVGVLVSPISVAVTTPGPSVRAGTTTTLSASASGGAGGPFNLTWSFADGSTAYGPVVTHTFRSLGPTSYSVRATDRLGAAATSAPVHLAVAPVPPPAPPLSGTTLIALGAVLGLVAGLMAYFYGRRAFEADHASVRGYVPQVDPRRAVQGIKVCRGCGATNVPVRRSCADCGASLPRTVVPGG
jgi:hypothetical protein